MGLNRVSLGQEKPIFIYCQHAVLTKNWKETAEITRVNDYEMLTMSSEI